MVNERQTPNTAVEQEYNTLAIVGFVLAILAGIVGLIISIIAMDQLKKKPQKGRGFALAGIIIGCVQVVIVILIALFGVALWYTKISL